MVECPECGNTNLEHTTNVPGNGCFRCENGHDFTACPECGSRDIDRQRGIVGTTRTFNVCNCGNEYYVGEVGRPW